MNLCDWVFGKDPSLCNWRYKLFAWRQSLSEPREAAKTSGKTKRKTQTAAFGLASFPPLSRLVPATPLLTSFPLWEQWFLHVYNSTEVCDWLFRWVGRIRIGCCASLFRLKLSRSIECSWRAYSQAKKSCGRAFITPQCKRIRWRGCWLIISVLLTHLFCPKVGSSYYFLVLQIKTSFQQSRLTRSANLNTHCIFIRVYTLMPRLNFLIFLPTSGWKYSCLHS